ncbi:MAG: lasso peptide biosynthesis B2 protein [Methanobacterium sp.]|uniref:lasso peptide biosynthesis B2 protein n=1 Tax=Methanobacterium sp. TaxID=2164 RepID=UPI003D658B94|nr:lasso peptide biosynthesis B2 protein [Methanobacterium sp.]
MRMNNILLKSSTFEKYILIKSFILLWIVRIMLWILPFSYIQKISGDLTVNNDKKNTNHKISINKILYSVDITSKYVPLCTCLTRALAAQILLKRENYNSSIKIGVCKDNGKLESHAWLEVDNKIVLGESETEYIPLIDLGEKTQ